MLHDTRNPVGACMPLADVMSHESVSFALAGSIPEEKDQPEVLGWWMDPKVNDQPEVTGWWMDPKEKDEEEGWMDATGASTATMRGGRQSHIGRRGAGRRPRATTWKGGWRDKDGQFFPRRGFTYMTRSKHTSSCPSSMHGHVYLR